MIHREIRQIASDGDKISEGFLSHVPLSVGCIELAGEENESFQSDSKAIFTTSLFIL